MLFFNIFFYFLGLFVMWSSLLSDFIVSGKFLYFFIMDLLIFIKFEWLLKVLVLNVCWVNNDKVLFFDNSFKLYVGILDMILVIFFCWVVMMILFLGFLVSKGWCSMF